jgi:cell division protein FtsI/penicillin-binding protein 2
VSNAAPRRRLVPAAVVVLLVGVSILARLTFLQVLRHGYYVARAEINQQERVPLSPTRGDIKDRQGNLLAQDRRAYSLIAVPRNMTDPAKMARRLARALSLDERKLLGEFQRHAGYCWVVRQQPPDLAQMFADSTKGKGAWESVFLEGETRRSYPAGEPLAQLVGRADVDNVGVEGFEYQFDSVLRGQQGWRTVLQDGRGRQIGMPGWAAKQPVDGHSIRLTIDGDIQSVVCERLRAAVDSLEAVKAIAVVLDPWTGEILAAGSEPQPKEPPYRNEAITDQFEPGSTFKLVAFSAILEEHLATPTTLFDANEGACDFGGFTIHDSHPHGILTLADAVRYSSNIVAGKVGLKLGPRTFYDYASAYGFGALTGVDYPGEATGLLRAPERWSGRSLPTMAMGHELSVSALQLALAYGAIANGGTLMAPQMLKAEYDPSGKEVFHAEPHPLRRIVSTETAATMRQFLQAVVDSGTATRAALAWAHVGGKTGTAQIFDTALHTYHNGKYLGSFVGFLPVENPRLVCVVMVDQPKKGYYGGDVAAPVFKKIMEDLYRLRGGPLAPRPSEARVDLPRAVAVCVPGVRMLPVAQAREKLAESGLRARVDGPGARVYAQVPAAGARADKGTVVALATAPDATGLPNVVGMTVREALTQLAGVAAQAQVVGKGVVVRQEPAAGSPVVPGRACVLTCVERDDAGVAQGRKS